MKATLLAVAGLGATATTYGLTIDFESPAYVAGGIAGQQGWATAGYVGTPNGTLNVSNAGALAGSQSLSYSRTEPSLAPNASDVVKADVVRVAKDGTSAVDLSVSYLISSSSLAVQGYGFGVDGLFLSHNGASGATPIGMRLNNAGSSIPSIELYADFGGSPAWFYFGGSLSAAAFPENDALEFKIDVDFDASNFTVAYRNATTGSSFVSSPSTYGFAVPYIPNADGTYDVDVIAAFRFGAGRIDNITFAGNLVPEPASVGMLGVAIGSLVLARRARRGGCDATN